MISTDTVRGILESNDIPYKDKGKDYLIRCLNPDHEDSKPSLYVHKETGKFHCFSCGFKGNIYKHFGVFVSPVKDLAYQVKQQILKLQSETQGLEIPLTSAPFEEDFRGISAKSYMDHSAFVDSSEEYLGRIVFPITDSTGKIVLFNGRNKHSKTPPKYKYFPKGVSLPVFPTHNGSNYLILVEGLLDYLNLYDKGVDNVSTIFGTNSLTEHNVEEKLAYQVLSGITTIVLLLDNDKAGVVATHKLAEIIERKLHIRAIKAYYLLPNDRDPGDLNHMEATILNKKIKKLLDKEA